MKLAIYYVFLVSWKFKVLRWIIYNFFFLVNKEGLEDAAADVPALVSHAVAERLKDLLEKCAVVAEHRLDFNKVKFK